jgi:hypothetical protein
MASGLFITLPSANWYPVILPALRTSATIFLAEGSCFGMALRVFMDRLTGLADERDAMFFSDAFPCADARFCERAGLPGFDDWPLLAWRLDAELPDDIEADDEVLLFMSVVSFGAGDFPVV